MRQAMNHSTHQAVNHPIKESKTSHTAKHCRAWAMGLRQIKAVACLLGGLGLSGLPVLSGMLSTAIAAPPPQPLIRDGSCPSGYYASGNYCVPGSNARFAIERNGSCPSGYYASGNYCVASSNSSKTVIHRSGSCPSGYYASGKYCVSSR